MVVFVITLVLVWCACAVTSVGVLRDAFGDGFPPEGIASGVMIIAMLIVWYSSVVGPEAFRDMTFVWGRRRRSAIRQMTEPTVWAWDNDPDYRHQAGCPVKIFGALALLTVLMFVATTIMAAVRLRRNPSAVPAVPVNGSSDPEGKKLPNSDPPEDAPKIPAPPPPQGLEQPGQDAP